MVPACSPRPTAGVCLIAALVVCALTPATVHAEYDDVIDFFRDLYAHSDAAIFPVQNQSLASIESAFGPRVQTTTQLDDFHRGIDVDGNLNSDPVVAPIDGYFYDYRTYFRGGHVVILEHHFSDFLGGTTPSITYNGQNMTRFYTWYMHLYDDEIADNGISTDDIVRQWKLDLDNNDFKTPISRGTTIGILGNSGSPGGGLVYGPHLHWEIRVGTNASLEYQLDPENNTTQWGFDPHLNPMLFFEPYELGVDYEQQLSVAGQTADGMVVDYVSTDDDMPLLNRWEVTITDDVTDQVVATHVLDYNQRTGFVADSTEELDDWDKTVPYVDPLAFGDDDLVFDTQLVVPTQWMLPFGPGYTVTVTATDIWGASETVSFAAIPEPGTMLALLAGAWCLGGVRPRR